MAIQYVPLLTETGAPLWNENNLELWVPGDPGQGEGGGSGKGGETKFDNRLWDIFQQEIALRHKPKQKPPEPVDSQPEPYQPAPPSGFFDAPIDPEFLAFQARARAEAEHQQRARNAKTISDLLRKASRS